MTCELYTQGRYAENYPTWHVEHSAWKAQHVLDMLKRNRLAPRTIAEVGCGAGEILKQLHDRMDDQVRLVGYDISPQAHALSESRVSERLQFKLMDFLQDETAEFDLILLIDVVEHIDDYYHFLRALKPRTRYVILHLPLDLSVQTVLRKDFFRTVHESAGHLHYFSQETARQMLADVGYEILDARLTASSLDLPMTSFKMALARLPRKLLYALNPGFACRLLGGSSLLVLAQ
ncbi:MAG: class I SAM-dependent methyltransferase [Pseudomonadota bacterium]|nr:class I SAM-dependent methyltransferase [Pseudomonadota bacterium]